MFDSLKITTSYLSFYCFWFKTVLKNKCKEFSRIVCVSLFSYQGRLSCDSFAILSCRFQFVKNFFQFFKTFFNICSLQQLFEFIISLSLCQELFSFFFRKKRRRRDLNPRAAINDLLPFQGSPFGQLGYFSKRPRFVICFS